MSSTESERLRGQCLVLKSRGLVDREGCVNHDIPQNSPERLFGHMWACAGCGMENDSRHLSCRLCETLGSGICP